MTVPRLKNISGSEKNNNNDFFESFKENLLNVDPIYWCEKYLTLDGAKFSLHGNGYKPFSDIYRYIGSKILEKNAKPVVLVKGRQVGATTAFTAIELYFMASGLFGTAGRAPIRVMHCFPTLIHVYAFTKTKLNTMMSGAMLSDKKNKLTGRVKTVVEAKLDDFSASNDSLQFKQFENGNHIWIESVGATGDRLRNRTIDVMFFDEIQDIPSVALGAATKILAKAKYGRVGDGAQVYAGTPKQKGGAYWKIWQSSTQQYYHLGCLKCKEYFPLYTPGSSEWENIWLYGYIVKCTKCGYEQDKREAAEVGKWISSNPNEKDCKFVGYHINQLYMPDFTKEMIIAAKPENHPTNTEKLYMNEILGEFYNGDGGPITTEEIHLTCADHDRKFRSHIQLSENKIVTLGCDWGGKDSPDEKTGEEMSSQGQSFSCMVVLTAESNDRFSIDYAYRLPKNSPEYKRGMVEQMFRQYSIRLAVGDIGYASDLTQDLQHMFGDRFLASQASAKINNKIKYNDDIFPKTISFEKDYYLQELFGLMKKGAIRFPYGDYEKIGWLVSHCASMEIKVTTNRTGDPVRRFVKGAIPNDGLMALLNAYLAYKFYITEGFKYNTGNQFETRDKHDLPITLGYLPRLR